MTKEEIVVKLTEDANFVLPEGASEEEKVAYAEVKAELVAEVPAETPVESPECEVTPEAN